VNLFTPGCPVEGRVFGQHQTTVNIADMRRRSFTKANKVLAAVFAVTHTEARFAAVMPGFSHNRRRPLWHLNALTAQLTRHALLLKRHLSIIGQMLQITAATALVMRTVGGYAFGG